MSEQAQTKDAVAKDQDRGVQMDLDDDNLDLTAVRDAVNAVGTAAAVGTVGTGSFFDLDPSVDSSQSTTKHQGMFWFHVPKDIDKETKYGEWQRHFARKITTSFTGQDNIPDTIDGYERLIKIAFSSFPGAEDIGNELHTNSHVDTSSSYSLPTVNHDGRGGRASGGSVANRRVVSNNSRGAENGNCNGANTDSARVGKKRNRKRGKGGKNKGKSQDDPHVIVIQLQTGFIQIIPPPNGTIVQSAGLGDLDIDVEDGNLAVPNQLEIADNQNNSELIDVTQVIFDSLKNVPNNKVIKSEQFQLLEGTRALEVLNPRLDTGLIELSETDYKFDCSKPLSSRVIVNIQTKLLKSLVGWLSSDSLPVTVLSCRYVQTLLETYSASQGSDIWSRASFFNPRLEQQPGEYDNSSIEYQLVHKVFKIYVMGLCKFINFILHISKNLLYEEEDITTRNMNLDFLSGISPQFLIQEINDVIEWIIVNEIDEANILISQLKVINNLLKIEATILAIPIKFLDNSETVSLNLDFYKEGIEQVKKLQEFDYDESIIPQGTFSKFIQLDMENRNIPLELSDDTTLESTLSYISGIFQTVERFIRQANEIKSINQFQDYLEYNINYPIDTFSVFSRGLFQLFFIRDDKSIFGSSQYNLTSLSIELVENLVGKNTIILNNFESSLSQLKDSTKEELMTRYIGALQDFEGGVYHNLTRFGCNPCRQQQLVSKGLVIWDTLQVGWESLEVNVYQSYNIGDEFGTGEMSLCVTSYIYYTKIKMMMQLLLNGFELELYKPFEIYLIIWYGDYLVQYLVDHLTHRITQIILGKIEHLETTIPKRIKKLKAGVKKEQLKELNKYNHEVILPQLTTTLNYNQDYLTKSYQTLQILLRATMKYLAVLSKLELVDFTKGPGNNLTSLEHLYYLRLKPWSSIGVPNFPTYENYQKIITGTLPESDNRSNLFRCLELLAGSKGDLSDCKREYEGILGYIYRDSKHFINDSKVSEWYRQILSSIDVLEQDIGFLSKLISQNKDDLSKINKEYKLKIDKGVHRYIPKLSVVPNLSQ
ncbi:N-alpha-acetyltransferase 35 NatC auxiliary subunit [Spathaspora sp. JA1]|nr:N-alpha-acetyltransferase 35 NatC auxiliary subunit [Spathaspora sp. JA1]